MAIGGVRAVVEHHRGALRGGDHPRSLPPTPAELERTLQRDLAGVGEGDGGAQRLLELTDVEGPGIAKQGAGGEAIQVRRSGYGATRGKIAAINVPRSSRRSRSGGSAISKPARRA